MLKVFEVGMEVEEFKRGEDFVDIDIEEGLLIIYAGFIDTESFNFMFYERANYIDFYYILYKNVFNFATYTRGYTGKNYKLSAFHNPHLLGRELVFNFRNQNYLVIVLADANNGKVLGIKIGSLYRDFMQPLHLKLIKEQRQDFNLGDYERNIANWGAWRTSGLLQASKTFSSEAVYLETVKEIKWGGEGQW